MDIKIDTTTNDIDVSDGDIQTISGKDGVLQGLRLRLRTFYQEWFLNTKIGVPYYEYFLVKNPDPVLMDGIIRTEIMKEPGVKEIIQFSIEIDTSTRAMTLTFKANTIDGIITYNEDLTP